MTVNIDDIFSFKLIMMCAVDLAQGLKSGSVNDDERIKLSSGVGIFDRRRVKFFLRLPRLDHEIEIITFNRIGDFVYCPVLVREGNDEAVSAFCQIFLYFVLANNRRSIDILSTGKVHLFPQDRKS